MFKKIVVCFVAILMAISPLAVNAADLGAAFNGLLGDSSVAVNSPGRYQSSTRNVFVAGGVDVRFGRGSAGIPALFSITPPNVSAGCGGLSAHFGGFSFINGPQIAALIKNIAQGAVGMVISLTIKTLCPMCSAVIAEMQKLAATAAAMARDSCRVSQALANTLFDKLGQGEPGQIADSKRSACRANAGTQNWASDFLDAEESVCNSVVGSMSKLDSLVTQGMASIDSALTPAQKATGAGLAFKDAMLLAKNEGNATWMVLRQMMPIGNTTVDGDISGVASTLGQRLLLMNLLGTTLGGTGANCNGTGLGSNGEPVSCLPTISPEDVMSLFMCGAPGSTNYDQTLPNGQVRSFSPNVTAYCSSWFTPSTVNGTQIPSGSQLAGNMQILDCAGDPTTAYDDCLQLVSKPIGDTYVIQGQGFVLQVNYLLRAAVQLIRQDKDLSTDENGRKVIRLINQVPYPLYQAINAAVVYPAAADELLDTMSTLVAETLSYQYLDAALKIEGRTLSGNRIPKDLTDRVFSALGRLKAYAQDHKTQIGRDINLQEALSQQIKNINLTVQKQVLTQDMLGQNRFAASTRGTAATDEPAKNPKP